MSTMLVAIITTSFLTATLATAGAIAITTGFCTIIRAATLATEITILRTSQLTIGIAPGWSYCFICYYGEIGQNNCSKNR